MLDVAKPLMQPSASCDPGRFRRAMRWQAGAVAVITVEGAWGRTGFTATSVTSLSLEPPRLLVCVNREASSYPALRTEGRFAVNLLAADQQAVAERFAGAGGLSGAARFQGARWRKLKHGAPALEDALACFDCAVGEWIERGTHAIIIADVLDAALGRGADALVYWQGRYRAIPAEAQAGPRDGGGAP